MQEDTKHVPKHSVRTQVSLSEACKMFILYYVLQTQIREDARGLGFWLTEVSEDANSLKHSMRTRGGLLRFSMLLEVHNS